MKKPTLTETLAGIRAAASEAGNKRYDALVQHLIATGAIDNALKVGDSIPEFTLASAEGRFVRSADILARGPAVLSFYRGAWCSYCSAELNALADAAPRIRAAGAALVSITAEAGGTALRTKFDRQLDFEILIDLDNGLALEFGLVFRLTDDVKKAYLRNGWDFGLIYGNEAWFLPVPATYIVRPDGVIAHAYVNADFRYRLDPEEILKALAHLAR
jgi:peroxiredoxin